MITTLLTRDMLTSALTSLNMRECDGAYVFIFSIDGLQVLSATSRAEVDTTNGPDLVPEFLECGLVIGVKGLLGLN